MADLRSGGPWEWRTLGVAGRHPCGRTLSYGNFFRFLASLNFLKFLALLVFFASLEQVKYLEHSEILDFSNELKSLEPTGAHGFSLQLKSSGVPDLAVPLRSLECFNILDLG